jgi:hypothetical protein
MTRQGSFQVNEYTTERYTIGARGAVVPSLKRQTGHDGMQRQSTLYAIGQRPEARRRSRVEGPASSSWPCASSSWHHAQQLPARFLTFCFGHRTDTVEPIWRALPCICPLHLRRCTSLTKHPSPAPPQIDHHPCRHHGPLFRRLPQLHAVDGHVLRESCTSDFGPLHCCCVSPQSGLLVAIYRQHKCSKPRLGRAEPPSVSDCVDLRSSQIERDESRPVYASNC